MIFEQMESQEAEWSFSDDFFSVKSDIGNAEFKWLAIKKLWKFNDVWLIFYANQSYSTLPVNDMSEEIMIFIQNKIISHGGKVT